VPDRDDIGPDFTSPDPTGPDFTSAEGADLDFAGLRRHVEAVTMVPEFAAVTRRARRTRRRARLATLAAVALVLAILVPAGLLRLRMGTVDLPPSSGLDFTTPVPVGLQTRSAAPAVRPVVTIVAAAGVNLDHVYGLVDVCAGGSCNLQLSQIMSGAGVTAGGPARIGLLRTRPTELLSDFQLAALSNTTLLVSAQPASGKRLYKRVELGALSDNPRPAASDGRMRDGDRAAVLDDSGQLRAFDPRTGSLHSLPSQPPLSQLAVAGSIPPADGLWVTGNNAVTGQAAVAVSRDAGRSWHTVGLGVLPGPGTPVLASRDGHTAYLLIRTVQGTYPMFRSVDGGLSWQRTPGTPQWPEPASSDTGYGLVVRADATVLAWLASSPATVYLGSSNGGRTFTNVTGPGGPVLAVSDGYVSLGGGTKLSSDGLNWANAVLPILPVSN
jgi:hypothetical protein